MWSVLVERELSFVVYDRNTERIIGTALNYDARAGPVVEIKSDLATVFELIEFCEGPIRYHKISTVSRSSEITSCNAF